MADQHRQKLKKHEENSDVYIEKEYIDGSFWMQPHFCCSEKMEEDIRWLYYRCIEQLKEEFDQKYMKVEGSFYEALAGRKAA